MKDCILCGETGSIKKFIYCQNKSDDITPVYFSDFRPTDADLDFPTRQTFFDIEEISIQAIKKTLLNKKHVSLTESEGNSLFFALQIAYFYRIEYYYRGKILWENLYT
jgi:hypothetical protein